MWVDYWRVGGAKGMLLPPPPFQNFLGPPPAPPPPSSYAYAARVITLGIADFLFYGTCR